MDVVVGLDLGTTSAKAVAFDAAGTPRGRAEAAHGLLEPGPGRVEQDPASTVDGALRALRAAIGEAHRQGARVVAVSVSAAMHAVAALDAADRPLTNLLTWADTRAIDEAERLRRDHPGLHGRTGTPPHPMAPLAKLLWLRAHEPQVVAAARRWVGVKELVLHRLCGAWVVDHSCASGTGMFALREEGWDPEALALAGVTPGQLARLVPATAVLDLAPAAAAELGLDAGTRVVAGGGDGPLANLGVGAVRPGVAACSIGTSGALRLVVDRPRTDPAGRVFCYALTPGRWVVGGAINNGGSVLQWVGDALAPDLGDHAEAALLDLAARVAPGSDGLVMLPYLRSERAPHWSAIPRGAYVGLTHAHTRGHLVRAALEGVCQQLALVHASMRDAGHEVREVRATGGFARSPFWRQLLADALGMPVRFPAGHEGSAFGAALVGLEALGLVDSIELAAELVQLEDEVAPDAAAAATYAALRPLVQRLYDDLAPAFRELRRRAAEGGGPDGRRR